MNACETITLTSTIVELDLQPTNEAQCRELYSVPKDKVAEVLEVSQSDPWVRLGQSSLVHQ